QRGAGGAVERDPSMAPVGAGRDWRPAAGLDLGATGVLCGMRPVISSPTSVTATMAYSIDRNVKKAPASQSRFRGMSVISVTTEWAAGAMVCRGGQPGRAATTRRIAAGTQVPATYLTKVTRTLALAGLVEAKRGAAGGHILARSAADVTVLDLINAAESG